MAYGTGPLPSAVRNLRGTVHPSTASLTGASKRGLDVAVASLVLVLLCPALLLVGLAVRLTSKGASTFRQQRIGLDGKPFWMYKFRTMRLDSELLRDELFANNEMVFPLFKMQADPRLTPIGRWLRCSSIDELPQLLNVLKGDMSLVGPRPPLEMEVAHFQLHHLEKFDVRPGITGLWQVSGRCDIKTLDDMIGLDIAYVRGWTLGMDFRILLRTIPVVFGRVGAM